MKVKSAFLVLAAACMMMSASSCRQEANDIELPFSANGTIIVSQIDDETYLLDDNGNCASYLVIGKKKALLIDTGYGDDNYIEVCRRYTDLPIILFNTHGHGDHIFGNYQFEEAYMSLRDSAMYNSSMARAAKSRAKLISPDAPDYQAKVDQLVAMPAARLIDIKDGDIIDLGGRELLAREIPGHTEGCMALIDKSHSIVYGGDSMTYWVLLYFPTCRPLKEYYAAMKALEPDLEGVKWVYCGHETEVGVTTVENRYKKILGYIEGIFDGTYKSADYLEHGRIVQSYLFDDWKLLIDNEQAKLYN